MMKLHPVSHVPLPTTIIQSFCFVPCFFASNQAHEVRAQETFISPRSGLINHLTIRRRRLGFFASLRAATIDCSPAAAAAAQLEQVS